jgi:putative transposase
MYVVPRYVSIVRGQAGRKAVPQGLKPGCFEEVLTRPLKGRVASAGKEPAFRPRVPFWNSPQAIVTSVTDFNFPFRDDCEMDSERIFFITTVTAQRRPIFRSGATALLLIETLAHYRDQGKFLLHEFVIMPDHLHALLTPAPEISLERAMQFIKGGFSYRLKSGSIWQASFTNHRVRDWEDFERHREYIFMNPVRARLASSPEEYPYSAAAGVLRMDEVPRGLKPGSFEEALTRP